MGEYWKAGVMNPGRRDIEFLFVLRIEYHSGMQNNVIPGGMEKLLRIYREIPPSVTELLRDYKSLTVDARKERLIEAGKKLRQAVMAMPGTGPRFSDSKVQCLKQWLNSHHDLARIEREIEREKDRRSTLTGDESLGGYRPYSANLEERIGMTTTQLRREQIQHRQDELRTSLNNTPWF